MDEPQTPRADSHAIPDIPDASGAQAGQNDASERFARGEDMAGLYAQMRPDQRTAVAGELVRLLVLVGDERVCYIAAYNAAAPSRPPCGRPPSPG
jgi:hypothetical protein